ncbi:MAG: type 2 lanthipeptide synthetase LanM family protein [bacterium]
MNEIKSILNCNFGYDSFPKNKDGNFCFEKEMETINIFIEDLLLKNISYLSNNKSLCKSISNNLSKHLINIIKVPFLYTFNDLINKNKLGGVPIKTFHIINEMFTRYPELIRLVNLIICNSINYFSALFLRLENDKDYLLKVFHIKGEPRSIQWPLGDFHSGGKTHSIIIFSCGKKIIYKNKKTNSQIGAERLILEIEKIGFKIPHYFPTRIFRKNYYWEEFIQYKPSESKQDMVRYFNTIGKFLGFFYFFGISDIINENIIASKDIPVFIDFESILKPTKKKSTKSVYYDAETWINESVISTGILPFWTLVNANDPGINFGGIAHEEIIEKEIRLYFSKNGFLYYKYINHKRKQTNIPFIKLDSDILNKYYSFIIKGFKSINFFFIQNKDKIINIINKETSENISTRIILRPTNVYDIFLKDSLHPSYISNITNRVKLFKYLYRSKDKFSFPKSLINTELNNLLNYDIPIFYYNPHEKYIYSNNPKKAFYIIEESGIEACRRRIRCHSKASIEHQIKLIYKSLACFSKINNRKNNNKINFYYNNISTEIINEDIIKSNVERIGKYLLLNSTQFDNVVTWIDISASRTGNWELVPKRPGIYDGLDGIGLFYLYAYKILGKNKYLEISKSLLDKSIQTFELIDINSSYHLFSPYNYPFSTLYFLWHYLSITNEGNTYLYYLVETKLIPYIYKNANKDEHLDVINGCSGILIFLIDLFNESKKEHFKEAIDYLYKILINKANTKQHEMSWKTYNFTNLVGFAHGNAGFLYALSKYYNIHDTDEAFKLLSKIINYNQNHFSAEASLWYDLRYPKKTLALPSWCHGSTGIILSYLKTYEIDNKLLPNINLHKILYSLMFNYVNSHCLCHGMLGNVEAILKLSHFLNERKIGFYAKGIIFNKLLKNRSPSWQTGFMNSSIPISGLMLGLSGIGYGILKTFWEKDVPSILLLEPPQNNT